eukprot:GHVS01072774.1.p1 GENE.GHVS01072774.1~~GHVS01072774.1.p1  ORF type:complete len:440 (-),score=88.06 GHVS01072774.1:206-1525(-)
MSHSASPSTSISVTMRFLFIVFPSYSNNRKTRNTDKGRHDVRLSCSLFSSLFAISLLSLLLVSPIHSSSPPPVHPSSHLRRLLGNPLASLMGGSLRSSSPGGGFFGAFPSAFMGLANVVCEGCGGSVGRCNANRDCPPYHSCVAAQSAGVFNGAGGGGIIAGALSEALLDAALTHPEHANALKITAAGECVSTGLAEASLIHPNGPPQHMSSPFSYSSVLEPASPTVVRLPIEALNSLNQLQHYKTIEGESTVGGVTGGGGYGIAPTQHNIHPFLAFPEELQKPISFPQNIMPNKQMSDGHFQQPQRPQNRQFSSTPTTTANVEAFSPPASPHFQHMAFIPSPNRLAPTPPHSFNQPTLSLPPPNFPTTNGLDIAPHLTSVYPPLVPLSLLPTSAHTDTTQTSFPLHDLQLSQQRMSFSPLSYPTPPVGVRLSSRRMRR